MTKNEIGELPPVDPPPLDIIPDNYRLIRVGQVSSVVGDLVLVQSDHLYGEHQALDFGSLLAFDDRKVRLRLLGLFLNHSILFALIQLKRLTRRRL
jgi:hypothetical protein